MRVEGHLALSIIFGFPILFLHQFEYSYRLIIYLSIILCSFIPDLDAVPLFFEDRLNSIPVKHRGFTHTIYFGILYGFVIFIFCTRLEVVETELPFTILIGVYAVFIHCIGDYMTPKGVSFIPPITSEKTLDAINYDDFFANTVFLIVSTTIIIVSVLISRHDLSTAFIFYIVVTFPSSVYIIIKNTQSSKRVKMLSPEE